MKKKYRFDISGREDGGETARQIVMANHEEEAIDYFLQDNPDVNLDTVQIHNCYDNYDD